MAGTVITDLAWFVGVTAPFYNSNCDQVTDWSGTPTLDQITFIQDTGALSAKVSKTTYTSVFSLKDPINLTGKVIYIWAMCSGKLDTLANGGLRIRVENAAAQFGEWYLAGGDTWAGGWQPWAVHTGQAFAPGATIPNVTAVTKVGIVFKTIGSATAINCWWDAMRYGTYIGVKGGTEGSPGTIQDILNAENNVLYKYGVMFEYEGVVIMQGKLVFGSTTGGEATYFKDTSEKVLIFGDKLVPASWYDILLQGNGTAATKIYFGTKVGGSGATGITARAANSAKPFTITASDTNITEYGFYGCTFYQASTITLQAYSAVKEFLDCIVSRSAEMLPDTGIVKNCTFTGSAGRALRMISASHKISDTKFINCQTAMHIPLSTSVSITNVNFYGSNPYDIEHSVTGALTINYSSCPYPPAEGKVNETGDPPGTTTITSSVTLTIRKVKTGNEPAEYVSCSIHKAADMTEIMNKVADVADDQNPGYYKASETYTSTGISVIARARERGWLPFETTTVIPAGGLDITAIWLADPNYV